jgi:hypothetical protein
MFKLLFLQLIASSHSLKVALQSSDRAQCPDVVNQTENVLFWGMILDGKDHSKGKEAYDWHGFKDAYKALQFMLATKPDEPLEWTHLMKVRNVVVPKNGKNFGWARSAQDLEGPVFRSYTCLECEHMKTLIADVPQEFWKIKMGTHQKKSADGSCPDYASVFLKPKSVSTTQQTFQKLIEEYNADMEKLTDRSEKLDRLTSFLKDYAFLHPWGNGNGRFRALMLNHEVRRLGLGCGAMMYNNNKDLYYITKKVYRQKIDEGIAMYDKAMASGTSPWVDENVVAEHKKRFDPDVVMPGLTQCRKMEPGPKSSYWHEKKDLEEIQ